MSSLQPSLFDRLTPQPESKDPWAFLRWFQREACDLVFSGFEDSRSQLIVMATGLGKTSCFSAIAAKWPGNVLMLAHREELVQQAKARLEAVTGEVVGIERAEDFASKRARIVCASVATLHRQNRLDRFGPGHFSLIIVDEAHHAIAGTYKKILAYFAEAKVLGVTATPDRSDERAMGKVFDAVPYVFDIINGIEQGYLVPLRGTQVALGEIQLDGVATVAGDLQKGQLDEVMVRAVEGICHKTLELEPNRQGIAFFPGVKSAQYACERWNALVPGSAGFVSGDTPPDERRAVLDAFRAGGIKYLCNCMVFTEGFDAPATSLIIQARPTKSRGLYAQMAGRGTRVLPGLVEGVPGREGAAERRALIASSGKPDCVILDFVGNATKHALISPVDLLGGDYTDEEVEEAKKKARKENGASPSQLLEDARKELRAVAAAVRSKVTANVTTFNPFAVLNIDLESTTRDDMRWGRLPPSEAQILALQKMKVPPSAIKGMSQREAAKMLKERNRRHGAGLSTYAQLAHLRKFGLDDPSVTFAGANRALTYISQQGWSPSKVDTAQVIRLAKGAP